MGAHLPSVQAAAVFQHFQFRVRGCERPTGGRRVLPEWNRWQNIANPMTYQIREGPLDWSHPWPDRYSLVRYVCRRLSWSAGAGVFCMPHVPQEPRCLNSRDLGFPHHKLSELERRRTRRERAHSLGSYFGLTTRISLYNDGVDSAVRDCHKRWSGSNSSQGQRGKCLERPT